MPKNSHDMPPEAYLQIWRASFLSIISISCALYHRLYQFVWVPSVVMITSLNHWRKPRLGLRQDVDVFVVHLTCTYQCLCSFQLIGFQNQHFICYWFCLFLGLFCYQISNNHDVPLKSARWHCGTHVFANVANLFLYDGMTRY